MPELLGDNLYSSILYGSAVRGGIKPGVSDINLLIILNRSTPEAHRAISECLQSRILVDPFILDRHGMERSFEAFAIKFRSIKRNYLVLYGEDPLKSLEISKDHARFLCEQAIRNLQLRMVHNYVILRRDRKKYLRSLLGYYSTIIVELTEVLRLSDEQVPRSFKDRLITIEAGFSVDVNILHDLLALELKPRRLRDQDIEHFHHGLFSLLEAVIQWIEIKWQMNI